MIEQASHTTERESAYLNTLLDMRPSLPVGYASADAVASFVGQVAASDGEYGWAWERLPRWLTEIKDAIDSTEGPIITLDTCSSLPLYAQLMRCLSFHRSGERANDLVASLRTQSPSELGDSAFAEIHQAAQENKIVMRLLKSGLQKILYTLNSGDSKLFENGEAQASLANRIYEVLSTQQEVYESDHANQDIESRWSIKYHAKPSDVSYVQAVAGLQYRSAVAKAAGRRMAQPEIGFNSADATLARLRIRFGQPAADRYVRWQADQLAAIVGGNDRFRPARFLSQDLKDPVQIARDNIATMPESTKRMQLFSHAILSLTDPLQHIRADIHAPLELPDSSLALITAFDGWPFYSSVAEMGKLQREQFVDTATQTIWGWYQKLAYGGKIVIFPWAMQGDAVQTKPLLDEITNCLALLAGHAVREEKFHIASLHQFMSEADRRIAETSSPVFRTGERFIRALIVEKPVRRLVLQHAKGYLERLNLAYQIVE